MAKSSPFNFNPNQDKARDANGAENALQGEALLKETCRRIRAAKGLWDAHRNAACRGEREKAIALYQKLTTAQKEKIPQQLRIWLRYRSEKYFGPHQTPPQKHAGKKSKQGAQQGAKKAKLQKPHKEL
jgi:hypothetical protein